jgi:hypothetical protein
MCDDHDMSTDLSSVLARVGVATRGWEVGELAHNKWLTPGVWHLSRGDQQIIVKQLLADRPSGVTPYEQHWTARSERPKRWNYWAREAFAYRDGIIELFDTTAMSTPACLGLDITDADAVVAMAFVDGAPGETWSIDDYATAGYALG